MKLSVIKVGLVLAFLMGAWHGVWSAMVLFGCAQPVLDFILRLHFIALHVPLAPFDLGTAAELVGLTTAVGLVVGIAFALIWNALLANRDEAS